MAKISRIIPFDLLPGSWGLKGSTRKIAEAEYYYDGEDLERKLVHIHHAKAPVILKKKLLALDLKYGVIDEYTYDLQMFDISNRRSDRFAKAEIERKHGKIKDYDYDMLMAEKLEGNERLLAQLSVQYKYGEISQNVYEMETATIQGEPYVYFVNGSFDLTKGLENTFLELDWNPYFVEFLRAYGFDGRTEEEVVDRWCQAWWRRQAYEAYGEEIDPANGGLGIRYTS